MPTITYEVLKDCCLSQLVDGREGGREGGSDGWAREEGRKEGRREGGKEEKTLGIL